MRGGILAGDWRHACVSGWTDRILDGHGSRLNYEVSSPKANDGQRQDNECDAS